MCAVGTLRALDLNQRLPWAMGMWWAMALRRGVVCVFLLPRCYQIIPNHADPRRTGSVPSVEIFELYIRVVFGGNTLVISLNQRVQGSSP